LLRSKEMGLHFLVKKIEFWDIYHFFLIKTKTCEVIRLKAAVLL
jgi:hypothetical protein